MKININAVIQLTATGASFDYAEVLVGVLEVASGVIRHCMDTGRRNHAIERSKHVEITKLAVKLVQSIRVYTTGSYDSEPTMRESVEVFFLVRFGSGCAHAGHHVLMGQMMPAHRAN